MRLTSYINSYPKGFSFVRMYARLNFKQFLHTPIHPPLFSVPSAFLRCGRGKVLPHGFNCSFININICKKP